MNLWLAFVGGVIVGWLVEWVIDWYYWRRGVAAYYATESALRRRLAEVEQEKSAALQAQEVLRQELEKAHAQVAELSRTTGASPTRADVETDHANPSDTQHQSADATPPQEHK